MKYVLLLLLSFNVSASWVETPDYFYQYGCVNVTHTVILYHGLNEGPDIQDPTELGAGWQRYYEDRLDKCALVALVKAARYDVAGKSLQVYDYTNELSHGAEMAKLKNQIVMVKEVIDAPIFLVGGSAGGFTSYKLANELRLENVHVRGIATLDGASPYQVSIYEHNQWLSGTRYELVWQVMGYCYFDSNKKWINAGFNTNSVGWDIEMLVLYSPDDPLVPEGLKTSFIKDLEGHMPNLEYGKYGSGHDVGPAGITHLIKWTDKTM